MVSRRDSGGGSVATASSSFIFGSSSTFGSPSPYESSSSSSTTTTHFFNVLSANAGGELTTVQHYNDIIRPKNINMESKNINPETATTILVLSQDCPKNRWDSFRDRSSSFVESTRCKITNKTRAMDKSVNRNPMADHPSVHGGEQRGKSINTLPNVDIKDQIKPLNIRDEPPQIDHSGIHLENTEVNDLVPEPTISRGMSFKDKLYSTRERFSLKDKSKKGGAKVNRTKSLMPGSFKRGSIWKAKSKPSNELPSVRRQGPDLTTRVSTLIISTIVFVCGNVYFIINICLA